MFHEDGHDHVDEDELGHQDEDDEEERSEKGCNTAVLKTVRRGVTLLSDGVLHTAEFDTSCRGELLRQLSNLIKTQIKAYLALRCITMV